MGPRPTCRRARRAARDRPVRWPTCSSSTATAGSRRCRSARTRTPQPVLRRRCRTPTSRSRHGRVPVPGLGLLHRDPARRSSRPRCCHATSSRYHGVGVVHRYGPAPPAGPPRARPRSSPSTGCGHDEHRAPVAAAPARRVAACGAGAAPAGAGAAAASRTSRHADQALRLPHAGRPVLRQLLRHLSRARTGSRPAPASAGRHRQADRRLRQAVPAARQPAAVARRGPQVSRQPVRRRRGWTASSPPTRARARRHHRDGLLRRPRPALLLEGRPTTTCSSTISSPRPGTASVPTGPTGCRPPGARRHRARIPAGGYGEASRRSSTGSQAAGVSWKFYVQGYNPHADVSRRVAGEPELADRRGCRCSTSPGSSTTRRCASHIVDLDQYYKDLRPARCPRSPTWRPVRLRRALRPVDRRSARGWSGPWSRSSCSAGTGQLLGVHVVLRRTPAAGTTTCGRPRWTRPPSASACPPCWSAPYARQGQVDHTVLDYTSALKFIEQNWRLGPLADRDARSNSLTSAFDFAAGPRPPVLLHAGAVPDPLPVTHPLSHHQVTVVYLLYGGAAAVSVLLLAFAALSSARSARRRRPAPASRSAATREAGG